MFDETLLSYKAGPHTLVYNNDKGKEVIKLSI